MRLLVVSDLHLETAPAWSVPEDLPSFDIAVLAGDIHCPIDRAIDYLAATPCLPRVFPLPPNRDLLGELVPIIPIPEVTMGLAFEDLIFIDGVHVRGAFL